MGVRTKQVGAIDHNRPRAPRKWSGVWRRSPSKISVHSWL